MSTARFCPQCGARREGDAPFCQQCGYAFGGNGTPPAPAEPEPHAAAEAVAAGSSEPSAAPARKGSRGPLLIFGAVLAILLVLALLWWTRQGGLSRGGSSGSASAAIDLDLLPIAFGDKCGFVDSSGKVVVNPQFNYAGFFLEGADTAPVRLGAKWGLVGRDGAYVVNPQYDYLGTMDSNAAGYRKLYFVRVGDKWGILDEKGAFAVNPQYDSVGPIDGEGRVLVHVGAKLGIIDAKGNYLISPQFDWIAWNPQPNRSVDYFPQGVAPARVGDRWGYIDTKGNWKINPQFAFARGFDESGLAAVQMAGSEQVGNGSDALIGNDVTVAAPPMWGFVDQTGRIVITPQFATAGSFSGAGLAPVKMGDVWGYVDKTGTLRINPQFADAGTFVRTGTKWVAPVATSVGSGANGSRQFRWGLIDETGAFAINPQFEQELRFDGNGRAVASLGNNFGLIDQTGKFISPPVNSRLFPLSDSGYYFFAKPAGPTAAEGIYEIGLMDSDGKTVRSVRGGLCENR